MAELTIVVPDLMAMAELAIRDPLRWPAMNRVLAQGKSLTGQGQAGEGFSRALGLKRGVGGLARYCFLYDTGQLPEGGCARLDPVEVGVGPRGLFLRSASMPDLQREEADALILELDHLMTEFGWHLEASVPSRWYVLTREPLRAGLGPPILAEGESLMERLAGNDLAKEWSKLLNEIQILLHQHPVNLKREQEGRAQANCLWPWGGGTDHSLEGARPVALWSDGDPVLGGIGKVLKRPVGKAVSLSGLSGGWFGSSLVSLVASGPREQRLDALERDWLAPIAERRLKPWKLILSDLDGAGYKLGLLDWWMPGRKKPLPGDG